MKSLSESNVCLELLAALRRLKRSARSAEANVRFALGGGKRLTPLSGEQIGRYRRDGFLLVPRLLPGDLVRGAEQAMWRCLRADPSRKETWSVLGPHPHILRDAALSTVYTQALMGAAAQLSDTDVAGLRRPTHVYTINNLPVTRSWRPHRPHIDGALPSLRQRTFPPPVRVGSIIYLTDVGLHGGGTMVYPGSHLQLESLARSDGAKYRYLAALNAELGGLELGSPVELTPAAGDVLFHHYLLVHATSDNASGAPRLALLHQW